ncbi:HK97 family phage prohead protease [Mesorhizobium sp. M1B.F.Ca.ET.045.04.1.1]|uniref:HK97 family phage prohead protease n=1 Tax=Mesorhizobium sp. M1B.F.Ca.ET.045.04.1.1 TaxID=2493673 RepID=UPI000F74DB17|nr:HK97 family phage prohead protease [Mesorhizobium sp. M1B.F.Ca.ET.045.04.1.1]AZO29417.1 hypothetical protein EJ071_19830 [Mesorhizobium sp. M1B.F.Ca.ET.045.04.1.1]
MAKFRKASADEVQAKRKDHVRDSDRGLVMVKGFKSPPSWNKEARSAKFVMTSESVDRYQDIVVQAGLNVDRFLENPQGLLFHNSRSWPCGLWSDVTKVLGGRPKRTEGVLNFLPEGTDEDADRAARHVAVGSIRTVSIGFKPNWDDIDFILDDDDDWTGGFRYNSSELLECSLVPIPAQPDALVKSAGGDMVLARSLIEEILDTYAKTPEGLLIPMDEYRAKHFDLVGNRSTFIIDKALAPAARKFAPVAEMELKASTDTEAEKFVGAKVTVKPGHPENKDWPFADVLAKATGEVIASYIVDDGEFKGVHALWVEFLTDEYSGMFRGIKADRFLLADKATEEDAEEEMPPEHDPECEDEDKTAAEPTDENKGVELLTDEVLDAFASLIKDGDVVVLRDGDDMCLVIKREGEQIEALKLPVEMTIKQINETSQSICDRVNKAKEPPALKVTDLATVTVKLDTTEATEKLNVLERLVDSVGAKISKLFGKKQVEKDTPDDEPEDPPALPCEAEVEEAKAKAAAHLARLAAKGLIAA